MKTLIVVLGPTGVGKTELCLSLAEHLSIPIINADSRQIFAELPIGTAAPTAEQQQRVKHYFVGNHHIEDYYSAAQYEADVMNLPRRNLQESRCGAAYRRQHDVYRCRMQGYRRYSYRAG